MKGRLLLAALRAKARIDHQYNHLALRVAHARLAVDTCSLMRRANLCSTAIRYIGAEEELVSRQVVSVGEVERAMLLVLRVVEVIGGAAHLDVVDAHHHFLGGGEKQKHALLLPVGKHVKRADLEQLMVHGLVNALMHLEAVVLVT